MSDDKPYWPGSWKSHPKWSTLIVTTFANIVAPRGMFLGLKSLLGGHETGRASYKSSSSGLTCDHPLNTSEVNLTILRANISIRFPEAGTVDLYADAQILSGDIMLIAFTVR